MAKFREAMTPPPIVDALTRAVNTQIEALLRGRDTRAEELQGEIERF